jgi:hypothetical protein
VGSGERLCETPGKANLKATVSNGLLNGAKRQFTTNAVIRSEAKDLLFSL